MFRLLRLLSTPAGRRVLLWLLVIGALFLGVGFLYESLNPHPAYTRPPGWIVTTVCATGGNDCDENGYVRLWTDTSKSNSTFVRSPDSYFCIATKSNIYNNEEFWWIDCGLWHGNELPVIEGWVSKKNLNFTGKTLP